MKKIILDESTYKKVKKRKKCIYVSRDNIIEGIDKKAVISNGIKEKQVKIKDKYIIDSFDNLKNKLGNNFKYITPADIENKSEKLYVIEFKHSLKLFKTFLIMLLCFILICISAIFIRKGIIKYRNQKFISNINEVQENEIMNVIVSINPSIALVVKNDTIIESYCLNDDCTNLLNKININYDDDINNQKFDEFINYFYDNAKKNGYDTSNGISISSSSSNVEALVKNINNSTFEYITIDEEKELLENVSENINHYTISKEEYNLKLLEELKKDAEYDKTYYCYIENNEVKCYMKDFMAEILEKFGSDSLISELSRLTVVYERFTNLLDKFDFTFYNSTDNYGEPRKSITLNNGKSYIYGDIYNYAINGCNNELIDNVYVRYALFERNGAVTTIIPFTKVNLLTKTYEKKDVIIIDASGECPTKVYYGIN